MNRFGERRRYIPGFGYVSESTYKSVVGALGAVASGGAMYGARNIKTSERIEKEKRRSKGRRLRQLRQRYRERSKAKIEPIPIGPPPLEDIPMVTMAPTYSPAIHSSSSFGKSVDKNKMVKRKSYKRRGYRGKRRKRYRTKSVSKAAASMLRKVKVMMKKEAYKASHTSPVQKYRHANTYPIASPENQVSRYFVPWSDAQDAGFGITNLIDDTLPTVNGNTVTWRNLTNGPANAYIKQASGSRLILKFRNNDFTKSKLKVYHATCKETTGSSPVDEFNNLLEDHIYNSAATPVVLSDRTTTPMININTMKRYMRDWDINHIKTVDMEPTDNFIHVYTPASRSFDVVNFRRTHGGSVQHYKGWSCGVVLELIGGVCHGDGAEANVGYVGTNVDLIVERVINFTVYQGEIARAIQINSNYDTLVGGGKQAIEAAGEAQEGDQGAVQPVG